MRYPASALCVSALLVFSGCVAAPTPLFNGRDLAGWEFVTAPTKDIREVCQVRPDGVIAATGQPVGFIATAASFENYRLHAEWRWPVVSAGERPGQPGNGGVLVHISSGPKDRAWPLCLQIQTKNKSVGDLLPMAGASFVEPLTSAPGAATAIKAHTAPDSEKPVGEWNSCDIICRGDTIEVTVNGVLQNRVTQVTPHAGRIGFQFEGMAFELRNVSLQLLE